MTERKPYCNPLVPTVAIDRILGWTHVGTPDSDVEQMVRERITESIGAYGQADKWTEAIRKQTIRYAIWRHHRNLDDYRWVMGSH